MRFLAAVAAAVSIFAVWYLCWQLGKRINYKLSYEDMVRGTVTEMVRKEALR